MSLKLGSRSVLLILLETISKGLFLLCVCKVYCRTILKNGSTYSFRSRQIWSKVCCVWAAVVGAGSIVWKGRNNDHPWSLWTSVHYHVYFFIIKTTGQCFRFHCCEIKYLLFQNVNLYCNLISNRRVFLHW